MNNFHSVPLSLLLTLGLRFGLFSYLVSLKLVRVANRGDTTLSCKNNLKWYSIYIKKQTLCTHCTSETSKKKQNLINLANFDAVSLFFQNYCMKFNTLKYCVGEECRKVKRIMNYGRISNSRLTLVCCNLQEKDCYVNIKRLYR